MAAHTFDSATIVLGMHRSGTSALAGALRICGLAAAKSVVPATQANERGFWESAVIKAFDDELLEALGKSWHSLLPIGPDDLRTDRMARARKRASAMLADEYEARTNIVLKEPRLCRLLPVWEPVLQKRARAVVYPLILRNPTEAAKSLARRNDFDLNHGILLWARYSLDAEKHTRGGRRAFLSYERLLDDPRGTIKALADGLDLPVSLNRSNLVTLEDYLSADLRHYREPNDDSLAGKPQLVRDTYEILRNWSEGRAETAADHQKLDAAREELDRMAPAVGDVLERARLDRKRWAGVKAQAEQTAAELSRLQGSFEQLHDLRDAMASNGERQSAQLAELAAALEDRARLEQTLAQASTANIETAAKLDLLRREAAEAAERFAREKAEAAEQFLREKTEAAEQFAREKAEAAERFAREKAEAAEHFQREKAEAAEQFAREKVEAAEQFAREKAQAAERFRRDNVEAAEQVAREKAEAAERFRREKAEAAEQFAREKAEAAEQFAREKAQAAEQFAREKAELEEQHRRAIELLQAENQALEAAREAMAAELKTAEEAFGSATAEAERVDAELQRTKRKYRGAQWDVERERRAHEATRAQLAVAEAAVARYRTSLLWRSYEGVSGVARRFSASGRVSKRKRRNQELQTVAASGLFDAAWYLATYPDVASAGIDPLAHFVDTGWREGRDPGPAFATSAYLKANPDVARSGVNPVVHYVEFGQSEGRGIQAHRHRGKEAAAPLNHDFPEPAPVFRGEALPDEPVRWNRSYRLDAGDPRAVKAEELVLGYAEETAVRANIDSAFEALAALCGQDAPGAQPDFDLHYSSPALVDAWYTNQAELRTRWRDDREPFVVRAYQHDPLQSGRLALVGEGLVTSDLDIVDVSLTNPYFPVLLLFSDPAGELRGARLLAFPSLCRGGLHYPELIERSKDAPDPLGLGVAEAKRLHQARISPNRVVGGIAVDDSGCDGTSPMFDAAYRQWLRDVAGVSIIAGAHGAAEERPAAGQLVLASDMVPTIHILGEPSNGVERASGSTFLPLLVAGEEPSQPATLVQLPRGAASILSVGAAGYPAPWPCFAPGSGGGGLPDEPGPAAIRLHGRDVSDFELLVPAAGSALRLDGVSAEDLAWLISAGDWQPAELLQAIRALSLQSGAGSHHIHFIGEVDPLSRAVADEFFGDRVRVFSDLRAAVEAVETLLVGHVGPGVVLHDRRSVSALAALLSDQAVISAGCVLLTTEERGKNWHVSVADGGTIALEMANGRTASAKYCDCPLPWRTTFAVFRPPRDLWIARASSVKSWVRSDAPQPLRKGMHVCTSLVTASYVGARAEHAREVPLPSASAGRSTKLRTLFG